MLGEAEVARAREIMVFAEAPGRPAEAERASVREIAVFAEAQVASVREIAVLAEARAPKTPKLPKFPNPPQGRKFVYRYMIRRLPSQAPPGADGMVCPSAA